MASPDTSSGAATKTDIKNLKRQARTRDEQHDRAYQAGLTGDDESAPGFDAPQSVQDAYDQGREDRAQSSPPGGRPGRPKRSPRRAAKTKSGPSTVRQGAARALFHPAPGGKVTRVSAQGASMLLGAIGYALTVSYIGYGWPGVTGWFSAKFINKVTIGTGSPAPSGPVSLIPNANPATKGPAPEAPVISV